MQFKPDATKDSLVIVHGSCVTDVAELPGQRLGGEFSGELRREAQFRCLGSVGELQFGVERAGKDMDLAVLKRMLQYVLWQRADPMAEHLVWYCPAACYAS